jgi:phage-related protein
MKPIRFHPAVVRDINRLDFASREELAGLLEALSRGVSLGMPVSRPMPMVEHGVHELRITDRRGELRTFYFTKHSEDLLVFHMFRKKQQKTPEREITLGRKRLRSMQ